MRKKLDHYWNVFLELLILTLIIIFIVPCAFPIASLIEYYESRMKKKEAREKFEHALRDIIKWKPRSGE